MSDSKTQMGSLSPDDKKKLQATVDGGVRILQEVADLNGGLKDTVKAVAEEFGVKPAMLSKAIRLAFKAKLADEKESFDTVEDILQATGYA